MKSRKRRLQSITLATVMALVMVFSSTVGSFAAGWEFDYWDAGAGQGKIWEGCTSYVTVAKYGNYYKEAKVTSVKSSKSSVLKVNKYSFRDENGKKRKNYVLEAKKPGNATITVKYKSGNKTKTKKKRITVVAYPKHISNLKVNGKKVSLKGDKRFYYSKRYKMKSAKIKLTPGNGWKITHVDGYAYKKNGKSVKVSGMKKKIKKGKKISFPKKYQSIIISVTMEKGDQLCFYNIDLYR